MNRRPSAIVLGAALLLVHGVVGAQAYPTKPVKIIVPNAPGGLADIGARVVAGKLGESMGQQFVVENRPGAGGTVGTAAAVKAPPDGYTLLVVFDSHVTNPHLFKHIEYDTVNDLAPISLLVRGPLVLVVNPRLPARTTPEFLRLARAKPGAINCATVGPGSPSRLLVELLKLNAGINVTQVPYKGAAPALTDLVGGHVEAMFATVPSISAHWKAGRLRALAVTSESGSAALPGVPPISQSVPGLVAESWVGLLAPVKTPQEIVTRLNSEAVRVLNLPDVRERFSEQGLDVVGSSASDFDRRIRVELERWGKLIRSRNITLE